MKTLLLLAIIFYTNPWNAIGQPAKALPQVVKDSAYQSRQRTEIAPLRLRPPRMFNIIWIMDDRPRIYDLPKEFRKKEFRKSLKEMIDYLPVSDED